MTVFKIEVFKCREGDFHVRSAVSLDGLTVNDVLAIEHAVMDAVVNKVDLLIKFDLNGKEA